MADVVARGIRFNVLRMGQGEPTLVMVHGLTLDNHTSFYMSLAPAVAKRASVILYDLRGHGLSEQPRDGYTGGDMVEDLAAILDALALPDPRVIVLGHSFGGYAALAFALRYPERTRGVVLLDAHSGLRDFGERVVSTLALEGDERVLKVKELFGDWLKKQAARAHIDVDDLDIGSLDSDAKSAAQFATRLVRQRRRPSPMVNTAKRLTNETNFARDVVATQSISDAELARIACPVLALYGELSDLRTEGERLGRIIPKCQVAIVPGCAHGILFHGTPFVRDTLMEWLDQFEATQGVVQ